MRRTGIKTKHAVVEEALRTLIGLKRQEEILALRGKLDWEATSTGCAATEPEPSPFHQPAPSPAARPRPFGGVAGTDSPGRMDHPKKALTRKRY